MVRCSAAGIFKYHDTIFAVKMFHFESLIDCEIFICRKTKSIVIYRMSYAGVFIVVCIQTLKVTKIPKFYAALMCRKV